MDASVGAWEPPAALGEDHARTLDAAAGSPSDNLALDAAAAARVRAVMNADAEACGKLFAGRDSATLRAWLRVLTLAEMQLPGCEAGARSPVIALAGILRARGDYPPSLTPWIRSVSTNRFLPYGSLKARLK